MKIVLLAFLFLINYSFVKSQNITRDSADNKIYTFVDKSAEFQGGQDKFYQFIGHNIQYPRSARRNGTQGKVFVKFVVERDGRITNVEVIKGLGGDLDKEAVRVIEIMPPWNPGELGGRKVRQAYTLPIQFNLGK